MASQLVPPGLSASVTRILALSGFPSELKTRDIQAAFSDWENINGGFKIKWRDDTSLLIVFADANTAKRAYLQALAQPPPLLGSPTSSKIALIRPYDGQDAQQVIAAVNARTHTHTGSRQHHGRASISGGIVGMMGNGGGNHQMGGNGNGNGNGNGRKGLMQGGNIPSGNLNGGGGGSSISAPTPTVSSTARSTSPLTFPRDHSPTLPNVPAHPTLSSLINLSLSSPNGGEVSTTTTMSGLDGDVIIPSSASAAIPIVAPGATADDESGGPNPGGRTSQVNTSPPRIGDPGRRMVGHALGIRHPGLSGAGVNRSESESPSAGAGVGAVAGIQRAMGGLSVSSDV